MKLYWYAVISAATLCLVACSDIPTSPAMLQGVASNGIQFVDFPAERRGAWLVRTSDGTYRICAEPPADAGLSTAQLLKLTAALPKADVRAGVDSNVATTLYEMKGRTPAVLALRDVMYRMCEARLNGAPLDKEGPETKLYTSVVDVINRFAIADLQAAQEQKERATAEVNGPTRSGRARAREIEGIAALGKQDWAGAQRAFEQCEIEYPKYHACYEFSKILKEKKTDAEKAGRSQAPSATPVY